MNYIPFQWSESDSLSIALRQGLRRASVLVDAHNYPVNVAMWGSAGVGLGFSSSMHHVAERIEVGVLDIRRLLIPAGHANFIDLAAQFGDQSTISKLIIEESDVKAESGISIKSTSGEEIIIVAGAFPCSLAVSGLISGPKTFLPEYPLERYTRIPIILEGTALYNNAAM